MIRTILLAAGAALACNTLAYGQMRKQFTVEDQEHCKTIDLRLKAKSGNCVIRQGQSNEILNVYSNQDLEEYAHSFSNEVKGAICFVRLALEQEGRRGLGNKISYQVFGGQEEPTNDKLWNVFLSESKPYVIDLDYGLGNANIDLSGLAVKKLKINTGSADVHVAYTDGMENQVEMDTFFVKVDLGTLNVKQINLSRSRVVMAEVGFGNIYLDFSNKPEVMPLVKGSVGAGNLVIQLPDDTVPVMVKITDSWLCSLQLCKGLRKISPNTYANAAYSAHPKEALTFDLDVSMGKIVFKEK